MFLIIVIFLGVAVVKKWLNLKIKEKRYFYNAELWMMVEKKEVNNGLIYIFLIDGFVSIF